MLPNLERVEAYRSFLLCYVNHVMRSDFHSAKVGKHTRVGHNRNSLQDASIIDLSAAAMYCGRSDEKSWLTRSRSLLDSIACEASPIDDQCEQRYARHLVNETLAPIPHDLKWPKIMVRYGRESLNDARISRGWKGLTFLRIAHFRQIVRDCFV